MFAVVVAAALMLPQDRSTTVDSNTGGYTMASNTLTTPKVSAGFDINAHFRKLMHELGLTPEDTGGSITFDGKDPACRYQPQRV
jgi:hypothetical protein